MVTSLFRNDLRSSFSRYTFWLLPEASLQRKMRNELPQLTQNGHIQTMNLIAPPGNKRDVNPLLSDMRLELPIQSSCRRMP